MRARLGKDHAPKLPPAASGRVRLRGLSGLSEFVEQAAPEIAGNAMLCAVNQAVYLLKRQLQSQSETFLESGGFTEKLHASRTEARKIRKPSEPACPSCGQPMLLRTARKGPKTGHPFWGCSTYPNCKATLPAPSSDRSD